MPDTPHLYADRFWNWQGHAIGYTCANQEGENLPAVLLIHGFGASVGHWRKNIPDLATSARVFAIDLIGFGASAKPPTFGYTFEQWAQMVLDFTKEVIQSPVTLVGNSIGAIVAMQSAVSGGNTLANPITKVIAINCSLRLLHESKQSQLPWYRRSGAKLLQNILGYRPLAQLFFQQVRQPQTVRRILEQAYNDRSAISEELIQMLLKPARDPHAVDVFMSFVRYSQGPTPEGLLQELSCPVIILWGDRDPWEPIELGKALQQFPAVQKFIPIGGAGHCPQDEVPDLVNPILRELLAQTT